jgi:hypothetical protein
MEYFIDYCRRSFAVEWRASGDHLIDQDAYRKDVGTMIRCATQRLFRGQMGGGGGFQTNNGLAAQALRAFTLPGRLQLAGAREPQSKQLDQASLGHNQIRAPDVSVNYVLRVGVHESVTDLGGDVEGFRDGEWSVFDFPRESLSLDVFHYYKGGALVLADVKDRGDVCGPEPGSGTRVGEEFCPSFGVVFE